MSKISFPFGDDEYTFCLRIKELRELQEKLDAGPMRILNRLVQSDWRVDDAREVIRLGLIGGGLEPLKALSVVRRYCDERPLLESIEPALKILSAALIGVEGQEQPPKAEPLETAVTTTSTSES